MYYSTWSLSAFPRQLPYHFLHSVPCLHCVQLVPPVCAWVRGPLEPVQTTRGHTPEEKVTLLPQKLTIAAQLGPCERGSFYFPFYSYMHTVTKSVVLVYIPR